MFDRDDVSREEMLEVIAKVPEITVYSNAPIETIRAAYQQALIMLENKKEQIESKTSETVEVPQDYLKENEENEQKRSSLDEMIDSVGERCGKRLGKGQKSKREHTEQERE